MSNWQYVSTGSGNDLAPNRRQTITWTNADPVHWRINVKLGGDELNYIIKAFYMSQIVGDISGSMADDV